MSQIVFESRLFALLTIHFQSQNKMDQLVKENEEYRNGNNQFNKRLNCMKEQLNKQSNELLEEEIKKIEKEKGFSDTNECIID